MQQTIFRSWTFSSIILNVFLFITVYPLISVSTHKFSERELIESVILFFIFWIITLVVAFFLVSRFKHKKYIDKNTSQITNEQIKLHANFINTIALSFIVIIMIGYISKESDTDWRIISFVTAGSYMIHAIGSFVLLAWQHELPPLNN